MTERTLDILDNFFNKIGENSINDMMMEYSYSFPYKGINDYVDEVCSVPYQDFISYLKEHPIPGAIKSEDITQLSNFTNCEIGFCQALDGIRRPMTFEDIGKILQNDGVLRTIDANKKYGENQTKTAFQLGLAQVRYGYWYISCLGKVYLKLDEEKRKALLCRTILRNRFYAKLFVSLDSTDVVLEKLWASAKPKESTKERRRSSTRQLVKIVASQACKEGYNFTHNLDFSLKGKPEKVVLNPTTEESSSSIQDATTPFLKNNKTSESLSYYLDCITKLHVNKNGNEVAPHKYILLLSILELVAKKTITSNKIKLDKTLKNTFIEIWSQYISADSGYKPNPKMPFDHMDSEPFWLKDGTTGVVDASVIY